MIVRLSHNLKLISSMYKSLLVPWSTNPSSAEKEYREAGLQKTQGTVFLLPPSDDKLIETFKSPPRPKTRMSSGAVALCKHFERGGASSENGRLHPFWPLPVGSNENKSNLAEGILHRMLSSVVWRNMMILHPGVAVYEIRNELGYGMRWTIDLAEVPDTDNAQSKDQTINDAGPSAERWVIEKVTFRGFLEPIIGMENEVGAPRSLEHEQSDTVALACNRPED